MFVSPCLGLLNIFLYWEESHGLVSRCSQGTSSNGFRQNHSYQQWMFIILDDSDLNHIGKWVYIYQTITTIYWMFQFVSSHFRRCPAFSNQGYTRVFSVEWPKMWKRTWNMLKPPVTSSYRLIVWLFCIYVHCCWLYSHRFSILPKGNRLTRRPCKADKFEIEIFEAKRQNAGICGTCQKVFARWTFISIGRRVTQVQNVAFRLHGESILFFEC